MSRIKEYLTVVVTDRTNMVYEKDGVIYVPAQSKALGIDKDINDCVAVNARRENPNDRVVQLESVMESKPNRPVFEEVKGNG